MHEFDLTYEGGRRSRAPIVAIAIADLVLRAIAARRAWRNKHRKWFVSLLVVSSGGVLPLTYLLFFSRRGRAASDDG